MSALSHTSRVLANLFAMVAAGFFALTFVNALGRTYEGIGMLITCFLFAGFFGVVAAMLYGCYRYARLNHESQTIRGFIWCFVILAGLGASALVARVVWVTVPFTR